MLKNLESSTAVVLLINITNIVLAVILHAEIAAIIWAYWLDSIIIGIFTVINILALGKRSKMTMPLAIFLSIFFAIHYGGLHFGYLVFLLVFSLIHPIFTIAASDALFILAGGALFFFSHLFSFIKNFKRDEINTPQFQVFSVWGMFNLFFWPYARIVPMHLTILAGGFFITSLDIQGTSKMLLLVFFMGLKTVADVVAHIQKHKLSTLVPSE